MKTIACIVSYLMAVVAANALVSKFGQAALPYTAFVLIPFDLFARDVLHEEWKKGSSLWVKMLGLIVAGSLLSYVTSFASARVSLASASAFLISGAVDSFVYWLLDKRPKYVKMNGSNFCSACSDSIIFPLIAFGAISPWLSVGQAASKFVGGFVWTLLFLLLTRARRPKPIIWNCWSCGYRDTVINFHSAHLELYPNITTCQLACPYCGERQVEPQATTEGYGVLNATDNSTT